MQKNLLNKKENNVKAAEKYLFKYIRDLQKHFCISDVQLIKILQNTLNHIKKRNKSNKWWQFF